MLRLISEIKLRDLKFKFVPNCAFLDLVYSKGYTPCIFGTDYLQVEEMN
jgi:hypothetical protein